MTFTSTSLQPPTHNCPYVCPLQNLTTLIKTYMGCTWAPSPMAARRARGAAPVVLRALRRARGGRPARGAVAVALPAALAVPGVLAMALVGRRARGMKPRSVRELGPAGVAVVQIPRHGMVLLRHLRVLERLRTTCQLLDTCVHL